MSPVSSKIPRVVSVLAVVAWLAAAPAAANGPIGEHVNDLSSHIDTYTEEVNWLIEQIDGIVDNYAQGGAKAAKPEAVVDHWEAVQFHSAIETHYIPLYASIWQGLFAVRTAMEAGNPVVNVRSEQQKLEQVLWQSLGAVKVAAEFQKRGLLPAVTHTQAGSPAETVDIIQRELNRVLAKYAEQLPTEAIEIVQRTYLTLFEGIEGDLIALDAALVEDLELDFNVTLPKAIQDGQTVEAVRRVVGAMQGKLDRCRTLLGEASSRRSDVF